ncbi:MAG: hypothetical protein ACRED0_02540 [Gammaproteobacteria bacterium]
MSPIAFSILGNRLLSQCIQEWSGCNRGAVSVSHCAYNAIKIHAPPVTTDALCVYKEVVLQNASGVERHSVTISHDEKPVFKPFRLSQRLNNIPVVRFIKTAEDLLNAEVHLPSALNHRISRHVLPW